MSLTPFNDNLDISAPKPTRVIDRVGSNYRYADPQSIPFVYRYIGLFTIDDHGDIWILKGGVDDSNWTKLESSKIVLSDLSIAAGETKEFIHNLGSEDFVYDYLEWDTHYMKYIKKQPLIEINRSDNSLWLYSLSDVNKFKLIIT